MDIRGILNETQHRPWPLPQRPWVMRMSWVDLAFFHWQVAPEQLRPLVPEPLELDLFDGKAWVAVTPFLMDNVRVRPAPPIPTTVRFEELNVRTYVRYQGKAGVWFFSLDAASRLAVAGARIVGGLPYFYAEMDLSREGGDVCYRSRRIPPGAPSAEFRVRYRPAGEIMGVDPGSLERWLTERYCLFTVSGGGTVYRLDIHHVPWPLQPATAEIEVNSMGTAVGITLPAEAPLMHYAVRLDVLAWMPKRV